MHSIKNKFAKDEREVDFERLITKEETQKEIKQFAKVTSDRTTLLGIQKVYERIIECKDEINSLQKELEE